MSASQLLVLYDKEALPPEAGAKGGVPALPPEVDGPLAGGSPMPEMKLGEIQPKEFCDEEGKAQVFSSLEEEECELVAQRALAFQRGGPRRVFREEGLSEAGASKCIPALPPDVRGLPVGGSPMLEGKLGRIQPQEFYVKMEEDLVLEAAGLEEGWEQEGCLSKEALQRGGPRRMFREAVVPDVQLQEVLEQEGSLSIEAFQRGGPRRAFREVVMPAIQLLLLYDKEALPFEAGAKGGISALPPEVEGPLDGGGPMIAGKLGEIQPKEFCDMEVKAQVFSFLEVGEFELIGKLVAQRALALQRGGPRRVFREAAMSAIQLLVLYDKEAWPPEVGAKGVIPALPPEVDGPHAGGSPMPEVKLGGTQPKEFCYKEDKAQMLSFLAEVEDVPGVVQSLGAVGPLDWGGRRF